MQIITPGGAFINGAAMAATLLYDACEPGDRSTNNDFYSSTFGACVAEIPAGLDSQEFRFFDTSPEDQEAVLRIGTEAVTFTLSLP